jgi:hypothetical protein
VTSAAAVGGWLSGAALLGAALLLPSPSAAQQLGRFRFAWTRDEGAGRCPDGPAIAREVTRRLGRDPFVTDHAPSIEASVQRRDGRWIARLVVRDADDARVGVREFTSEAADCGPIASAVTLGTVLSIDPEAALRVPPPVVVAPAPAALARPRPVAPWSRRGGVSARALLGLGIVPGAAPGVAIAAEGPITRRLRWSAGMMYFPGAGLATTAGSYAFGLVAAWVAPCFDVWRSAGASLAGCAGVDVGAIRSVVLRGDPAGVGERPWVALFAAARLRGRLAGPLAGELGAELTAPLVRDRFFEGGAARATAFQQGNVAGVVFAGVGVQFP